MLLRFFLLKTPSCSSQLLLTYVIAIIPQLNEHLSKHISPKFEINVKSLSIAKENAKINKEIKPRKEAACLNEFLIKLEPWYPALCAFCFFTILRYVYKHFLLNLLRRLTNVISFKNGEDLLTAFEHPINVFLYVSAFYAAINLAPLNTSYWLTFLDRIIRSTLVL